MEFIPKAFIFDMNGTMIDDMAYHTQVWRSMLNQDLGASLSWEEVKMQMYGKNSEVLERVFGKGRFTEEEMYALSIEKEKRYQRVYQPHLKLIAGLTTLLDKAVESNIHMAIGSAAIPFNINFVLNNLNLHSYFKAIVSAEDVKTSKPDPETFLKAASQLNIQPNHCLVFEDAPKGVECAQNAGMQCVVLLTAHDKDEFAKYNNVLATVKDYNDPVLQKFIPKI